MSDPSGAGAAPRPAILLVASTLLATAAMATMVLASVRSGGNDPVALLQPGLLGPSTEVIAEDFPEVDQPADLGLDGQQFYVMSRHPLDLERAADGLDRPRYRWQRPALPWLAALASPVDRGTGLVIALLGVNVAAVVAGGLATGALVRRWGGPAAAGALFPLLPGAYWSVRTTTADALALAAAILAICLLASGRWRLAIAAGVVAVLAKEVAIAVLAGWWLAHRHDRRALAAAAVPGVLMLAWAAWLRLQLPGDESVTEVGAPLTGLVGAARDKWLEGAELWGMASTVAALLVAALALWLVRLRHPLSWVLVLQLLLLAVSNQDVLGNDFGGTRSAMTLLLVGLIVVLTRQERRLTSPSQKSLGRSGPGDTSGGSSKVKSRMLPPREPTGQ